MIANRIDINDRDLIESAIKDLEIEKYFREKQIRDEDTKEVATAPHAPETQRP